MTRTYFAKKEIAFSQMSDLFFFPITTIYSVLMRWPAMNRTKINCSKRPVRLIKVLIKLYFFRSKRPHGGLWHGVWSSVWMSHSCDAVIQSLVVSGSLSCVYFSVLFPCLLQSLGADFLSWFNGDANLNGCPGFTKTMSQSLLKTASHSNKTSEDEKTFIKEVLPCRFVSHWNVRNSNSALIWI